MARILQSSLHEDSKKQLRHRGKGRGIDIGRPPRTISPSAASIAQLSGCWKQLLLVTLLSHFTIAMSDLEAGSALKHTVIGRCPISRARVSKLCLPHYTCDLPMFMPVGTCAAVKGMTTEQLEELDCHLILANTYHLALQPSTELVQELGGIHKFMNWRRAMLTDSGGFQMVSLLKLAEITEEGVEFQSPAGVFP